MSEERFVFGPFVLAPQAGRLSREGISLKVGVRALSILAALVRRAGEVVTRTELIDAAWQGAAVEESNLSVQIAALRRLLGRSPEGSEWIATVPRLGYRFTSTVDRQEAGAQAIVSGPALEDRPSIAVLPFVNLSEDPSQEYFADGMVDDIITGLSRIRWLAVIARNSTFAYKGRFVDVRQVGQELRVRYVLEGGVRKTDGRVRINAQLVDAATGAHLWAERFDEALKDVFELQDRITEKVVAVVEPRLQRSEIERARRKRPESLDAYDLYLRALPHTASQMPEDARIAMPYLERALAIEPDYAAAHALLAWCHEWSFARAGFAEADRLAALEHARAATAIGTDDATALAIGGFVLTMLSRDYDAALAAIDRALEINPSCATAMYLGANSNAFAGNAARAGELAERAIRLSPFDLLTYQAHLARGLAALLETRYADAASFMKKAVQAAPGLSSLYFCAAAALALAGDASTAATLAQAGLQREPGFRSRMFAELMVPQLADRLAEGCRMVGLPR